MTHDVFTPPKRQRIEYRVINKRYVQIIRRGYIVGKRGPKKKEGKREPNGRLDRGDTMSRLNEMTRRDQELVMAVVLAQPHRRNRKDNVTDKRLAHAVGRFCKENGLDNSIVDACDEYLNVERRWMSGWGAPRGHERYDGGSGAGPTAEQMSKWLEKIKRIEKAVRSKYGEVGYSIVRRLVIEDLDPVGENQALVKSCLCEIAVALDFLNTNPHPFMGG